MHPLNRVGVGRFGGMHARDLSSDVWCRKAFVEAVCGASRETYLPSPRGSGLPIQTESDAVAALAELLYSEPPRRSR